MTKNIVLICGVKIGKCSAKKQTVVKTAETMQIVYDYKPASKNNVFTVRAVEA